MRLFLNGFLHKFTVNRDLVLLLIIGGLYALGLFLSNTFVNVFLWRQTNDYMTIATYNLAIFIFQPITFVIAGKLAKMVDRIFVLRLGVIFIVAFFLTVLLMDEKAAFFNVLLGCLLGIGYGFYWLAFNVLTFEITEPETRDVFNGFMGALESLGGMIGPLMAGIIIANLQTNIGYMTVFSISLALFVIAYIVSIFIERRSAKGNYNLQHAWRESKTNSNWRNILNANLVEGLREGIFVFVITIWVYLVTKSEFALGIYNLCLSGSSLLFYFIVIKLIVPERRRKAILIGSIFMGLSIFIIVFHMSYTMFIVYAILVGIFFPVLHVPFNSLAYDVIGKCKKAGELRIEYVVLLEIYSNIGRVLSVGVFIICLMIFQGEKFIPYIMILFSFSYLFIYYYMRKINLI